MWDNAVGGALNSGDTGVNAVRLTVHVNCKIATVPMLNEMR